MSQSKKTRGPNFSSNEKEILIHLITKYKDVVENKKTDAVTTNIKNEGWRKLTEEFNSLSSFSVRNTDQLKTCWDNIKRTTRKDKAKTKKEIILTGGGRPDLPPPGAFQGQVEVILGPTLTGLENPFDSDAQYHEVNNIEKELNVAILTESEFGVAVNEPIAGQSKMSISDECLQAIVQDEPTTTSLTDFGGSKLREDECSIKVPEDKSKKMWNGWSPAALKTKVSEPLTAKTPQSLSWLQRRRPKASLHDKLLESKLELVELMKKNCESEAKMKEQLLEQQLEQEKIKTKLLALELKLKEAQGENTLL